VLDILQFCEEAFMKEEQGPAVPKSMFGLFGCPSKKNVIETAFLGFGMD
jgi:hypothetical protein